MVRRKRLGVFLLCLICGSVLAVYAQSPTASPSTGLRASPTPVLTVTPIPVLVVTPAVTPTPPSPWPESLEKAWGTVRAFWGAFGWWVVPILLLLVVVWFGKPYLEKVREKLVERATEETVEKPLKRREKKAALDEATRNYLEVAVSKKYRLLDLKALDPEMYRAKVRLREVYIPLRARGGFRAERAVGIGREELEARERDTAPALTKHLASLSRLVVLGRAGSGKSTFLRYTASILADALLHGWPSQVPEELATLKAAFDPPPLPIYFPLRDFVPFWEKTLKPEEKTLARQGEAMLRFLEENFGRYGLDREFFRERLREGRCLIFLDGLDEVKEDLRTTVVGVVESFVQEFPSEKYDERPNRYVIACRPEAFRGRTTLREFTEVTVEPLTPEQVEWFIPRWYLEVMRQEGELTPEGEREAEYKTRTLLQAIEAKPQVQELTANPLLLTLITIVHHRHQLPESRAELYDECTRLLLKDWEEARPGEYGRELAHILTPPEVPSGLDDRRYYLEPAAFWLLEAGRASASRREWAEEIARRLGLPGKTEEVEAKLEVFLKWAVQRSNMLEEREEGNYTFAHHRTFQEYLAARYLAGPGGMERALKFVPDRDWWEVLPLMVPVLRPDRRGQFLWAALETAPPEGMLLVASCLAEFRDVYLDPRLENKVLTQLQKAMTDPDFSLKEVRVLSGNLLARLGDPRLDVSCELPALVKVPGDTFLMGTGEERIAELVRRYDWAREWVEKGWFDGEKPQHSITLSSFRIGKYPVTNAQFAFFVRESGYKSQGGWRADYPPEMTHHPVVNVTWYDAAAYCRWLTERTGEEYRLPTEAEWEYAARGPEGREWPWGDEWRDGFANTAESGIGDTSPVGIFQQGESWCRAQDMAGSVWEWTASVYSKYPYLTNGSREDLKSEGPRVLRGGSWYNNRRSARCADRYRPVPDYWIYSIGFRVVAAPALF
jgi:formylglycine-generating enzyme required for sulfatase activity